METRTERVQRASRERREAQREELRRRILDTAADMILAEGYERFSLRGLAERIGYSATTIYRHYADKDDLLLAVIDQGFERFGSALAGASEGSRDPVTRIEALGRAYLAFGLENPVYYQLMFMRRPEGGRETPPRSVSLRTTTFLTLQNAVDAAMSAGALRRGDARAYSNALWSLVHGLVALAIVAPERAAEIGGAADLAMTALLDGLRK